MIKDIRDKLVTIITELVGVGKPLNTVFAFQQVNIDNVPVASVSLFSMPEEERLDTASNLQNMVFLVRVLTDQKQTENTENLKIELIEFLADKIRQKVNVDTLGGLAIRFGITGVQPIYITSGEPLTGYDMFITASAIVPITL